jgi:hypothetical protein
MYVEVRLYSCTLVALLLLAMGVFWSTAYVFGSLHTIFWLVSDVRTQKTCWQHTLKITEKFTQKKNCPSSRALQNWIPKATNTHSEYVILTAFPLQQWLQERA